MLYNYLGDKMKRIDFIIVGFLTSLVFGLIGVVVADSFWESDKFLIIIFLALIILYLIYFIVIILHELGHYVFGRISGYTFSSFRVLNIILIKLDKKYKVKKMGLAGTAGQCVMIPPKGDKMPYVLFNLGGIIFNFIFAIISIFFYFNINNEYLKLIVFIFIILNVYTLLINGIPFRLLVNNDMRNIILFKNDKEAFKNFFDSLRIQDMISTGLRLKDISDEYIYRPKKITSTGDIDRQHMYCNKLMDEHNFKKAIREIKRIVNNNDINMIYKADLINDLIYCYIILDMNTGEIDKLRSKEILNVFRQMKDNPSILRTEYAYQLVINKDEEEANKILNRFNKVGKTFPYESLYLCDKELINLIKDE